MKKLVIILTTLCVVVSSPVFATGNGNGATQNHTCQGGHNCNEGSGGGGSVTNSGNSTVTNTNNNSATGGNVGNITNNLTGGNVSNVANGGAGGAGGNATNTSEVSSSSSANNGGVSVEGDDVKSLAQYFQGAQGKDEMQIGSVLFGGMSVSNDSDANNIRQSLSALIAIHRSGLVDDASAKYIAHTLISEMKESAKADRCLGIKQSRKRSLLNGFKLIC